MPLSLGMFDYVNIWPIYYRFLFEEFSPSFQIVKGTPSELNRKLADGEIACSSISSIEFPRLQDKISLFPALVLASENDVKSVILVSKKPFEKLSGGIIATTNASSTSSALLQIILARRQLNADLALTDNPLVALDHGATAALLIGDQALLASESLTGKYYTYDLGKLWKSLTGKPFVWALWAIRNEHLEDAPKIYQTLLDSRALGVGAIPTISERAAGKLGIDSATMEKYYRNFDFYLLTSHLEGLQLYYDYAYAIGLAPRCPEITFAETIRCSREAL